MATAVDGRRLGGDVSRRFSQSMVAEERSDTHESLKDVCKKIGVKKAGLRIAGLGNLAWR